MGGPTNEEVIRRYAEAHRVHDYDTVGAMRHAEWLAEWPQLGERVRGHANDRAIMDNWPGGLPATDEIHVSGSEDRWVVTPFNTIHRLVGSGDTWWVDGTTRYPDGSEWFFAALITLREGLLFRETWYFAQPMEPPAWRAPWVERIG